MKFVLAFFLLSLVTFTAQANTCVCTKTKNKVQDIEAYGRCIADIPPSLPSHFPDEEGESDEQREAREAIERARVALYLACETQSWYWPVELILLAEGQKVKLEEFKSREACLAEKENSYGSECR